MPYEVKLKTLFLHVLQIDPDDPWFFYLQSHDLILIRHGQAINTFFKWVPIDDVTIFIYMKDEFEVRDETVWSTFFAENNKSVMKC